jgi:hypothetical protein
MSFLGRRFPQKKSLSLGWNTYFKVEPLLDDGGTIAATIGRPYEELRDT